jgi:hypothetical protein
MSVFNAFIAYKFLKILSTPFEKTDAYKSGVIDKKGNQLVSRTDFNQEQKQSYSIFHHLIFKMKKLMSKVPILKSRIGTFAAALWFIKETIKEEYGPKEAELIEEAFIDYLKENGCDVKSATINENFKFSSVVEPGTYIHEGKTYTIGRTLHSFDSCLGIPLFMLDDRTVVSRGDLKMKNFNEFKEEIANVAGSGNIAGLGSQPPVSKKNQKIHRRRTSGVTADTVKKESVELDERRQDVYAIVDKKGKVVASKLTKQNAHKEISRHRGGTIVLDPDAKTGDVLKTFARKESVGVDEATKWKMGDGRPRGGPHIENIRFWDMPKDKLQYIIKDAGKAMKANPKARKATTGPGNWADQVNDAHTVLGWRKKKGIKEAKVPAITFIFPDERKAKQFDLDIENSSIGLGNRVGNKVTVTGVKTKWRAAVKKAMLKNKGKLVTESVEESTDTFAGSMVFKVTSEEYDKCFHGRSKNERWKRKLNMDEMERCDIRTYHHKNPSKSIIVQNERTGEMTYLVKGETTR